MTQNFKEKLEDGLSELGSRVINNGIISILMKTMQSTIPFNIVGSLALMIMYFPFIDKFLSPSTIQHLKFVFSPIVDMTLGLISVYISILIGYFISQRKKSNIVFTTISSLGSFLLVTPFETLSGDSIIKGVIPMSNLGATGIFVAIIMSFIGGYFYVYLIEKKIMIKMPELVPENVKRAFEGLIPITLLLFLVAGIRFLFSFTDFGFMQNFIYYHIQSPITKLGTSLPATIIAVTLIQIFWFLGLHGGDILLSVMGMIWLEANIQNAEAYAAGIELPNIITKTFFEIYSWNHFIAIIIVLILFSKSAQNRTLGKLSAPAGFFNISETVVFGLPVMLNIIILIPWILSMVIPTVIAYFAIDLGIVPKTNGIQLPWTTPIFISGFLATGSIKGALLQLFNLIICIFLWIPFIKIIDKKNLEEESKKI